MLRRILGVVVAAGALAAPVVAQRAIVLNVNAGAYQHLVNLNAYGNPIADFTPGYNLGFSAGLELSPWVAVHGDVTFANAHARGLSYFSGADVERFFYGVHFELRYPQPDRWTPYGFLGAGAVTVTEPTAHTLPTFTRPAGMFGFGAGYRPARTAVELFAEGKGLVYRWNVDGFNRMQTDVTFSLGVAYRVKW